MNKYKLIEVDGTLAVVDQKLKDLRTFVGYMLYTLDSKDESSINQDQQEFLNYKLKETLQIFNTLDLSQEFPTYNYSSLMKEFEGDEV